jgi:oligopeptide transport system ATP-binding protein
MIFQDPYSSLNPRHTVGTIVGAPFRYQQIEPPGGIKHAVQELLERVGLSAEHYNRYPSDFSGGQRQRICVARAVALGPRLIVADEPVSALDVSIQAQIVNLVSDLQAENDMACLFISHDLSVVRHVARRVAVMYLGRIVEIAEGDLLYANPLHPYTNALLSAAPVPDPVATARRRRIRLSGELPSALDPPSGCRFRTRCWKAEEICAAVDPPLAGDGRQRVACHFPESGATPPGS